MRQHAAIGRSRCRRRVLAAAAIGLFVAGGLAEAQSTGDEPAPAESNPVLSALVDVVPLEPKALAADPTELCGDKPGGLAWIDRMQASLYRRMCLVAAGFDGFFGNARFDDVYEATYGSVSVGTTWDQRDQLDPSIRFRVNMKLPQFNDRFNGFIGRLDPEEYVTDLRDDFDSLPRQFGRADDDAVLLGLGYRQPGPGGGRFDTSVGAKLDLPPEAYVKGTYRLDQPFLERNLLRLNETVFWRDGEGFGFTSRIDLERLLAEGFLLRWTGLGTISQETEGVQWFSNVTLYQNLGRGRALAYQVGGSGETDHEVDIADYGLRVIYRRKVFREWLFLELRSSVTWPRETISERRETNWGAGVALEMQFGERRRKRTKDQ
jgi:hypothetical protein